MKVFLLLSAIALFATTGRAQQIYQIRADSVRIYNTCDTAELILENRTQNTPGFLFNKGRGRTEFRKIKMATVGTDAIAIVGQDTLKLNAILDNFQSSPVTGTNGKAVRITDVNSITKSGWYFLPATSRQAPVSPYSGYRNNVYFYASRERDSLYMADVIVGSGMSWYANGMSPEDNIPVHFVFSPFKGAFDSSHWKFNIFSLQDVTDVGNQTTNEMYAVGLRIKANQEVTPDQSRWLGIGAPFTRNIPYFLNRFASEHPKDFPAYFSGTEWVLSGSTFDTYKNTGDDSNDSKYGFLAIHAGSYDRHAATVGQLYNFGARPGTATKPIAQFTQGKLLTTPVNGAWEFNGAALYFTIGGIRKEVQLVTTTVPASFAATNDAMDTGSVQSVDRSIDSTISRLLEEIATLKERVSQLENKLNEK